MIISTNLTPKQIADPEDIKYKRIFERIAENCEFIKMSGDNIRMQNGQRKRAEMRRVLGAG